MSGKSITQAVTRFKIMPLDVLSVAQMREWEESSWKTGISPDEVIACVGRTIGRRVVELSQEGDSVLLLAGKGHNGDDVRASVSHIPNREVQLLNVKDPESDLQILLDLKQKNIRWVVDGLFGIGLNRPLNASWVRFIQAINEQSWKIVSVDVPSGLNAQTGEIEGAAVRATMTLTLGAPKTGLLKGKSVEYVGRLEVLEDVGLCRRGPVAEELQWWRAGDFAGIPEQRRVNSHKGTYGHVGLVAGSLGYHGAAVLASLGAERAQPGLVSLFCTEDVYLPVASQLKGTMVHPIEHPLEFPARLTSMVWGPGLVGDEIDPRLVEQFLQLWWNGNIPLVVDASALAWLKPGPVESRFLRVITPHPGEAASLLNTTTAEIQSDRLAALRALSSRYGNCRVVLKGHQTLVGRNTGPVMVNSSGNPSMAKGGTGDILAGYLGGLLAQLPGTARTADELIRYAVWRHGNAGDLLSGKNRDWTVEKLVDSLGSRPLL